MATVKDINMKGYCDTIYSELSSIRKRIRDLAARMEETYGTDDEIFRTHQRHFCELADFVEWKLQLISKVCPHDWKGFEGVEGKVEIQAPERLKETEKLAGYMGG